MAERDRAAQLAGCHEAQLAALRLDCADSAAHLAELQASRRADVLQQQQRLSTVRQEKSAVEAALLAVNTKCDQLAAELLTVSAERGTLVDQNATLRAEFAQLQQQWQLADVAANVAGSELDGAVEARSKLTEHMGRFEEKIARLEAEKERQSVDVAMALQDRRRIADLDGVVAENVALRLEQAEWQRKVTELCSELGADATDDVALETAAARLDRLHVHVTARLSEVHAQCDDSQAECARLQDDLSAAVGRLETQELSAVDRQRLVELQMQLLAAERTVDVAQRRNEELQQLSTKQADVIADIRMQLAEERATMADDRGALCVQRAEFEERLSGSEERERAIRAKLEEQLERLKREQLVSDL